jgi:type II secretory pathway component PulM
MSAGTLTAWYARQSPRDQRVLRIGAIVVAAILLLWLVLLPQRALNRARANLADQQELLGYMRQVGPVLAAAGPGTAVQPINESFVVFIDRTAREHGLAQALTGSPPAGNGAFRVTMEGADFNLLLTWMHQLSTRYGVRIEAASVNGGAAGKVNASVQVRPPA